MKNSNKERGVALLYVLGILALLMTMGLAFVSSSLFDQKAAANNANDFQHARFFSAPLKRIVAKLIRQGGSAPLLLVDPPRQGLDGKTICKIAGSSSVKNMIYVSCAPDTLTRDLKILSGAGFKIISTQMLNMFPRTAHLESITWVRRP